MAPVILWLAPMRLPVGVQILLVLGLIAPMGFSVYRLAFRPLADRSVLILLFMAVAVHNALTGFGQIAFGSESFRTPAFLPGRLDVHVTRLSYQFLLILAVSVVLMLGLWLFTQSTLWGKALRATAMNRFGARLVGVRTEAAGGLAMVLAAAIGALSGVLIGPVTALYYDSGFGIGVKGFIGTVIGGMVSFPLSLLGAILVGQVETFASFYASAYKEVLVYALLIPFLLWRSAVSRIVEDVEN
jgi:branched-chain amino acid transport system permease protein